MPKRKRMMHNDALHAPYGVPYTIGHLRHESSAMRGKKCANSGGFFTPTNGLFYAEEK